MLDSMQERLQKTIARAGVASRRRAEELIANGSVSVNGVVVQELGTKVDPSVDTIRVDGRTIHCHQERRYLVLNKPKGCITSTNDPQGRRTVMDLLGKHASKGLFPVGRLDYNTEGLLLLTDDGDFANRILSAKHKIAKTYHVKVSGRPSKESVDTLRRGIKLDGRLTKPESIRILRPGDNVWYQVTLVEGRNRQVHRMFERIGHLVEKIRRVRIGTLTLRGLEPRQVRELLPKEVQQLLDPRPGSRRVQRSFDSSGKPRTDPRRRLPSRGAKRFGERPRKR